MIKINKFILWIGLIMFLNLRGLYLFDSNKIPCADINIVIELGFMIYVLCKCGFSKHKKNILIMLIIPIALVITSAIMANNSYNQPLKLGIMPQRHWIFSILMYFPIYRLLEKGKISREDLLNLVDNINILLSFVIIAQFVLKNSVIFMQVTHTQRYGSIRLYISVSFFLISYFRYLIDFIVGKKISIKGYYLLIITLFIYFFITKSRMAMAAILITTTILICVVKLTRKKMAISLIFLLLLGMFFTTSPGKMIIESMTFDSTQDTSIEIREIGREVYKDKITKSAITTIFGCGYANSNWKLSVEKSGIDDKYFYNDQGILGLIFYYGIFMLIWIVLIYKKFLTKAWKNDKTLFFVFVAGVLGSYTLIPECYSSLIAFPITCALIEYSTYRNNKYRS